MSFLRESKVGRKKGRGYLKSVLPTFNPHSPTPTNIGVCKASTGIEIQYVVWYDNVKYKKISIVWYEFALSYVAVAGFHNRQRLVICRNGRTKKFYKVRE